MTNKTTEQQKDYETITLCLLAVSGDCAAEGMGGLADVMPFCRANRVKVSEFLQAQLDWEIASNYYDLDSKECRDALGELYAKGHVLIEARVLEHKWHLRTRWELRSYDEVMENNEYKKGRV